MVRHTEKAKLLFEENFVNLQDRFVSACRDIEDIIDSFDSECFDRTYLRKMEDSMNSAYKRFELQRISWTFLEMLRQNVLTRN
jgi:hypothetical protein